MLAPAGTPAPIVQRLNSEILKILERADVKQRLLELGVDLRPNSPEDFADYIKKEVASWAKLVKDAGIEPE